MQYRVETRRTISHGLSISLFLVALMLVVTAGASFTQTKAIDLNTASEKELESIKGVGPATAKKIVAGRPYNSVDDLAKAGIGAKAIEGMKPFVTVGKPASTPPVSSTKAPASPPSSEAAPQKAVEKAATAQPAKLAAGQKVNINTATKEQLEALPGIGPVKAQAVIDGRPYKSNEDIMKVKGIKEGTFKKIKDSITVQ